MACNTAHLLLPALQLQRRCHVASLIESTVHEIQTQGIKRIGIMASPTTIRSGLYEKPLRALGIDVHTPSDSQLIKIERAIRCVIAGSELICSRIALRHIQEDMFASGAQAILLGCTELSVLFPEKDRNLIDPLHIITNVLMESRL